MKSEIEKKAFQAVFLSPFSFIPFLTGCTLLLCSLIGPWQLMVGGIWAILGSIGIVSYRYARLDAIVEKVINQELKNKQNEKWDDIDSKIKRIKPLESLRDIKIKESLINTLARIKSLNLDDDGVLRRSLNDCCDQFILYLANGKSAKTNDFRIKVANNIDSINQSIDEIIESRIDNSEFRQELEQSLDLASEIRQNTKKIKDSLVEE